MTCVEGTFLIMITGFYDMFWGVSFNLIIRNSIYLVSYIRKAVINNYKCVCTVSMISTSMLWEDQHYTTVLYSSMTDLNTIVYM